MGWIGSVRCEKFQGDFMAQTRVALIAQVQPILHRVPCSMKILPNAPKCYATHQNKSLGSTWLDLVCSFRKIPRRLHGTNLCINCTSSTHFAPSSVYYQNIAKCTEMLRNTTKQEFRVNSVGSGVFIAKNSKAISWHEHVHLLHRFNLFCTKFCVVMKDCQMHTNTMKRTKT